MGHPTGKLSDNAPGSEEWKQDISSGETHVVERRMPAFDNGLLNALPVEDARDLARHMESVALRRRQQLQLPHHRINTVYFLEQGLASVLAGSRGRQMEVAMIGRDGTTGLSVLLQAERSPQRIVMQVAGRGQRIEVEALRRLMNEKSALKQVMLRYAHTYINQMADAAVANAKATVPQRVARWLVMAQDRLDGNEIPITHEALAASLGTGRPGVTAAIHDLVASRRIATRRGCVAILDRDALLTTSAPFYASAQQDLLGQ